MTNNSYTCALSIYVYMVYFTTLPKTTATGLYRLLKESNEESNIEIFFKPTQFPVFCWHLPRASIIYFRAKRMLFIAWSCCILVFPFAFVYFPRLFLRWCYPKFRSLNKLISKIKSSNFCLFLFGKGDENS